MKKKLIQLRHAAKGGKGADGMVHISEAGLAHANGIGALHASGQMFGGERVDEIFVGVEPRLTETADAYQAGLGYSPRRSPPIVEIGGDEWSYSTAYPAEMIERKGVAGCTWFAALIMYHGEKQVKRWAMEIAEAGIRKMLDQLTDGEFGLAFGHAPDMLQFAAWSLTGFPKLENLLGGAEHVEELGGYCYTQDESGLIVVKRVKTLDTIATREALGHTVPHL